jgi:hypothetical protein
MRFLTILKTGIEVLHLGAEHAESNMWTPDHWKQNKGRWRLYTPAIDAHLNQALAAESFGESVEHFVLVLEVADFASWGGPPAFSPHEGRVTYKPKSRELWSVGQIDWLQIRSLPLGEQYKAYQAAALEAVSRVSVAKRQPKHFAINEFANELTRSFKLGKVSQFSRKNYLAKVSAAT